MASLIAKQIENNEYYISLGCEMTQFGSTWVVEVLPLYSNGMCGRPIKNKTFSYKEQVKAEKLYQKYVKEYIG